MKKSDFTGWKEVYSFTFSQAVKQKSYAIFLIVFSVIALFSSTFSNMVRLYGEYKDAKAAVDEIVIFDETGLPINYDGAFAETDYKNVPLVSNPSQGMDVYEKAMEENGDKTLLINIAFDEAESVFRVRFIQGKNVSWSEFGRQMFAMDFCDYFEAAGMEAVGVSEEQQELIQTAIETEVLTLTATGEVEEKAQNESISMNDYMVILMLLVVCMLLINLSANQIALSIVTEKSGRVLEYLVLNVRPLALITGKLVATIVTSSLQMITVGFCYLASPIVGNLITPRLAEWILGISDTAEMSVQMADESMANSIQMIHGIKIEYTLLAILFVVLGIVLFGIIAGLLGASVSKMDEMQEAMSLFQVLLVAGCYADIALCMFQLQGKASPLFNGIVCICPLTSPFWVPANLMLGKMSWSLIIASFITMLVAIALVFKLAAGVYEAMIFYNGKVLKIKDILALASSNKKSLKKGEVKNEK